MSWCKVRPLSYGIFCQLVLTLRTSTTFITFDQRDESCRGNFTDVEGGEFKSHNNGDQHYPSTKKCGWLMQSSAEEAQIITNFQYFDVAKHRRCNRYDILHVYERSEDSEQWNNISPNQEGYCGSLEPFTVAAKSRSLYITFASDDTAKDNGKGFRATFNIKKTLVRPEITNIKRIDGGEDDDVTSDVINVVENDIITIQCNKTGLPNPSATWFKIEEGNETMTMKAIREDLVKTVISNGSIQLHNIKLSDDGQYACNVTNKVGSAQKTFRLAVKERCLCPKTLSVYWYDNPPYTRYAPFTCNENKEETCHKGILYNVVNKMVQDVCGRCEKGHNSSVVDWNGVDYRAKKLTDVQNEISNGEDYDLYLPLEGEKDASKYMLSYNFLPIVESPGVAFMVVGEEEGSTSQAVLSSILDGWPILVMTIIMAFLSGIIIWMLDTYWNEEQFPRSIREGVAEGFWWAFVTMTTVGYGDIAPRGVPGRLFAIVWILCGLVIIAIFTSVVTTSLTVVTLSTKKNLYGSKVGAISNSAEYRMGIIKNAEMKGYKSFGELHEDMNARKINGCLIDSYVAAYYSEKFQHFRVNNVLSSRKAHGIVLGKRLSSKQIIRSLQKWIESNQNTITSIIEENTNTLKEPSGSAAMEKSSELFNPRSSVFQDSIVGTVIILIILTVGGLMFEYGYLRPRHRMIESAKNLEMIESKDLKEMAERAKKLKEMLLVQVSQFHERWTYRSSKLKAKHQAEIAMFHAREKKSSKTEEQVQSSASEDLVGLDSVDHVGGSPSEFVVTTV